MTDHATPTEQQLLEHGAALRRIARSLLQDPHQAEDVVQDTYIAALTGTPGANLGRWMRGAARKLSLRRIRSESRRRRRETEAGREASTSETQAEVLSDIAAAVRQLREPYRTAIVMRYWQGLPPRVISRELGVPLNTVRSRLVSGLSELRRRLDVQHGSRQAWATPLLAIGAPSTSSVTAVAGLAAAAVLLTTTGTWAWISADADPDSGQTVVAASAAPRGITATGDTTESTPQHRKVVPAAKGTVVRGRLVAYGSNRPLSRGQVRLITERQKQKRRGRWLACDEDGAFAVPVTPRRGQQAWIEVAAPERANTLIDLSTGEPMPDVGAVPVPLGARVTGAVRDEAGAPIAGVRLRVSPRQQMLRPGDRSYPVPKGWDVYRDFAYAWRTGAGATCKPHWNGFAKTDAHGEFDLPGLWLAPFGPDETIRIANLDRCKFVRLKQLDQGPVLRLDLVMRRPRELPRITGTLVDDTGKPVSRAKVVATSRDWSKVVAHTDANGRFELIKSLGADEADHVTLAMPPIVAQGFVTVAPKGPLRWGATRVQLRARRPVAFTLTTEDAGLDLRLGQLDCFTFVDADCETGGRFVAERREKATAKSATFTVPAGVTHLALRDGPKHALYLGLVDTRRQSSLEVGRHEVTLRLQDPSGAPVRGKYLDLRADFAGCDNAGFVLEATEILDDPFLPQDLRSRAEGVCRVVLGCPPERCAVRFVSGRKRIEVAAITDNPMTLTWAPK